jgi:hypothetical protein
VSAVDDILLSDLFSWEGASPMRWEQASRCSCWSEDTKQPEWGCALCGGKGIIYADPVTITGLFRSQSRWTHNRREGELDHAEAVLTVRVEHTPGYVDRRVRDRYLVIPATGDEAAGRLFVPSGPPTPFIFDGTQHAWRVQVAAVSAEDEG